MDEYRMLAEHLGKDDRIRVIISGTEAKTDGTTIHLPEDVPEEVQSVLLATLLHESYQIRFTDKRNEVAATKGKEHRHNLLNVLEDIRLDHKVMQDWPNASNLYRGLVGYYDDKHADAEAKLSWQVQVLQRLVRMSYGVGFEKYQPSADEALQWMIQHEQFAQEIVAEAQGAPDTQGLYPLIEKLIERLFPDDPEAEKQKQVLQDQIEQNEKQAKDKADERRQAQAEAKEEFEKAKDADAQARDHEKEAARAKGQAKEKRGDAKSKKAEGDKAGAEQAEKEAEEQEERADDEAQKAKDMNAEAAPHYEKLGDLEAKYKDAKAAQEQAQKDAAAAHAAKQDLDNAQDKAAQAGLSGLDEVGIGFEKISKEDLKVKRLIPENIEDDVLHFLRCREERRLNASEGRIDPRKLPTFYQPDTLFTQTLEDAHFKTRVHFLVDVSGSMDSPLSRDEKVAKWKMAGQAVTNIAGAIERGIAMDGLEIEYGIFGFDDAAHEIKGFEKPFHREAVLKALTPRGGTDPRRVIEDVEAKHQPDNCRTKQVVFMITDGEFGQDAYKCLEQRLGGAIKWVFLGLDVNTQGDSKGKELFGKYNIVAAKDLKNALGRALIDNLE